MPELSLFSFDKEGIGHLWSSLKHGSLLTFMFFPI